jgi:hypothetical protein
MAKGHYVGKSAGRKGKTADCLLLTVHCPLVSCTIPCELVRNGATIVAESVVNQALKGAPFWHYSCSQ